MPSAVPSPSGRKGREKNRALSPQGISPTPRRVAGFWYPVNEGTEADIHKSGIFTAFQAGEPSGAQQYDLGERGRGPEEESATASPSPRAWSRFLPRDEGQVSGLPF